MLYVINQRTTPEGIYWVPGNKTEYVDRRLNAEGHTFVYGSTTVGALRALERRGYTFQPAGSAVVHRYAYASTDAGRLALEAHLSKIQT